MTPRHYSPFIALPLLVLLLPLFVDAQFTSLELAASPAHPRPGEAVTIRAQGAGAESALLSWRVNGSLVSTATGEKEITLTAGGLGSVTRVSAIGAGVQANTELLLIPSETELIWHAHSYIPPLYRGKALPAADGLISVTALPRIFDRSGTERKAETLIYTWSRAGVVLGQQSGRGKKTLTTPGPKFGDSLTISVAIHSADQQAQGGASVDIDAVEPKLLVYENNPRLGLRFERALPTSYVLENHEVTLSAYPYFISADSRNADKLLFSWNLNGQEATPSAEKSSLVLRQTGTAGGSASLSLTVQNLREILQGARSEIQIIFGTAQ